MPASDKDPLIIAIPCYAEEDPGLILSSLDECENPGMAVVVILLINSPENPTSEVFSLNQKAREYALQHSFSNLVVVPLHITHIPTRIAGVGLARKLAMDLAARWYSESGLGDRPILCCDMDCRVEKNYLVALDAFFKHRPTVDAVSIYFEHPVHEQQDELLRNAIIEYEIHLRYLISGQRWAGHPHAFHTVGSSMAVRAAGYLEQGGMNRRKAGEDFYFLHKFSRVGKLADCQDTTVFPAPRISDRVPFGTGRALLEISEGRRWETIAPNAFLDLKSVIDRLKNSFGLEPGQLINQCPESFQTYSEDSGFVNNFIRIRSNSASPATFLKNLFQWFDAFRVMKYTHHCRDHYYPNQSVESAVNDFFQWAYGKKPALSGEKLLEFMRREEKSALNP
ncbi:MAG: hypothetical protein EA409_03815 [Saprospirales bacterium]|nr:MAG: hypothetical protein EA409_03815 [Saprospirales bacterium]